MQNGDEEIDKRHSREFGVCWGNCVFIAVVGQTLGKSAEMHVREHEHMAPAFVKRGAFEDISMPDWHLIVVHSVYLISFSSINPSFRAELNGVYNL